jgi:hypothetical protein
MRVLARIRERLIAHVVMAQLITCGRRANKPRACEAVQVAVAWAATFDDPRLALAYSERAYPGAYLGSPGDDPPFG